MDRLRKIESLPPKGGYSEIFEEKVMVGGEAANTALALSTWGHQPVLYGNPFGTGSEAEAIEQVLKEAGIQIASETLGAFEPPFCDVYVSEDGERTMFGRGFREMEERADPCSAPYRAGEYFTADPNHGEASRVASRLACAAGMKLYLLDFIRDNDPVTPGCWWQSSTDWVGYRGNTQKNVEWVRTKSLQWKCEVVLSDGPNGLCASTPEGDARHYPPYPCPEMVDSTGAGDVFRAGMLHGLAQGWTRGKCLAYASAAGCLNCAGFGATGKLPVEKEVIALIVANMVITKQYDATLI